MDPWCGMRNAIFLLGLIGIAAPAAGGAAEKGKAHEAPATAPVAASSNVLSLSFSPSFYGNTSPGGIAGNFDNAAVTANLTHSFASGLMLLGTMQWQYNPEGPPEYYAEAGLGYALPLDRFTLTPSATLGVTWDATDLGPDGDSSALYYALYLNGDLKLNERWTWNAFQLMWRNAFEYRWITPSAGTGLTYQVNDATSLFGSANYSWTVTGQPSDSNSFGFSFGVSQSF